MEDNDISEQVIRPQKLILDGEATIEDGVYTGYYIGEKVQDIASNLVERFPNKAEFITDKVKGKMGTTVEYIQWWTNDYLFFTLGNEVLDKTKNPHWNYTEQVPAEPDPITGVPPVDEMGQPVMVEQEGRNHFKSPQMPYIFLSIFNLGKRPHEETNIIYQNIPLQDLINKRLEQISRNADGVNGGLGLSGDAFTEEQAAKAGKIVRKGGTLWVPSGPVGNSVQKLMVDPLPGFIYESLVDYRNELRNIFGIRGSAPQGTINEKTVGGKVLIKGQDTDRIGGGISTYLEQFSDRVYNWYVQLMYVYYDEPHFASVLGKERAMEQIELSNSDLNLKLTIGVKEGSMVPHDPLSKRNEAMDLWNQKALDPITLFDRLEFPNPRESAKSLYLWMTNPVSLFPDLEAEQQMMMQEQGQQQAQQVVEQGVQEQQKGDIAHAQKLEQIETQKKEPKGPSHSIPSPIPSPYQR